MSRNFHVKPREPVITESEVRFIRNLSIVLGLLALALGALPVAGVIAAVLSP
jgi:hypothetical protein